MPRAIRHSAQRNEPWANGTGTTRLILREPDDAGWRVRVSVAVVPAPGPFSEWPDTRRILIPLDAPMALRFANGRELAVGRLQHVSFDGAPAPTARLPEGPTRDFNLMLRGDARGEAWPRTLVGSMLLPGQAGTRWLVYLDHGEAQLTGASEPALDLAPGDAALADGAAGFHWRLRGAGEIVLVKLYA